MSHREPWVVRHLTVLGLLVTMLELAVRSSVRRLDECRTLAATVTFAPERKSRYFHRLSLGSEVQAAHRALTYEQAEIKVEL